MGRYAKKGFNSAVRCLCRRWGMPYLAAFWLTAGTLHLASAAEYTLTYTGLHDWQWGEVIDASTDPSPFVSGDNYVITAAGDDSGGYGDVSFLFDGIYVGGGGTEPDCINLGNITLTAIGGIAANAAGPTWASVYGIGIESSSGSSTSSGLYNFGGITVSATAGSAASSGGNALADAYAFGLFLSNRGDLTNTGTITASASGGTAASTTNFGVSIAMAYGIYVEDSRDTANTGAIVVSAVAGTSLGPFGEACAEAWGIEALASGNVVNAGNIRVTAIGGTATIDAYADAFGIYSENSGNVVNTGNIRVTAIGGTATIALADVYAFGIYSANSGNVVNAGNITVTGTGGTLSGVTDNAYAYGIYIEGDTELTNTGVIQAFGSTQAYEVWVDTGTTTLKETYRLTLDGESTTGAILISAGAALDINTAALTLSTGSGFAWDTEYRIFQNSGTVSGAFGSVSALNPNVTATYYDQGTGSAADDGVSLGYSPVVSPFSESLGAMLRTVSLSTGLMDRRIIRTFLDKGQQAASLSHLFADSGAIASDAVYAQAQTFFAVPCYTRTRKAAAPTGYEAKTQGIMAGREQMGQKARYGFHLGFGHTKVDYTGRAMDGNQEDQFLWTAGLHAMGDESNWTWQARATGFAGETHYKGLTGADLGMGETADGHTVGLDTSLAGGYLFRLGPHRLMPQAGLGYTGAHREGYSTTAENSAWNLYFPAQDIHQAAANASLNWQTRIQREDLTLIPSLAAGLRCLLTDDTLDISQSVSGGTPVTLTSDQDRTTGTLSASLGFQGGEKTRAELTYAGEFGETTCSHSVWVRINYKL